MNTEIIKFLKSIGGKMLLFSLLVFLSAILNLASSPNPTTIITLAFSIILIFVSIFSYKNNSKSGAADKTRNAELEAVIQNVKDGVIIYDTNFRILDLNAAAEEIFKISKEEVLGVQIQPEKAQNQHFRIFVETIFPSLASSINTISDSGWPKVVDITFEDPHLELRTYLNQVTDDAQNVIGFIKTVSNDTRENTILKSKGEFLTVAAHQLRTPLTAISWTFESIKNFLSDDNTTKNKEDLKKLTDEGWGLSKRSLKIIDDLLNAAKIEEGRFGFNFEKINLVDFLKSIKNSAEVIADEYGVKILFSSGAENYEVYADPTKLGMAVTNILDNAIKYNVKGGNIDILIEPDTDTRFVRVSIADTGIGIPKENLPKIFQKFYRSENAQHVEPNGSGLGMYITKNIIESHGGKVFLESQVGRGTTFWFTLPTDKSLWRDTAIGNK